jgi:hypothetical protein
VTASDSPAAAANRLAVYSATDGSLMRLLTSRRSGDGAFDPTLSADGLTVAFERGRGACHQTIDTVPFAGGPERVLVPMGRSGHGPLIPSNPSFSADGRYLAYTAATCSGARARIHVRDLATGRELVGRSHVAGRGAFVNSDRDLAFADDGRLAVLHIPSFARRTYPGPDGCRYLAISGSDTQLVATLTCRRDPGVWITAVSTTTFVVTTLARLLTCRSCTSVSLAPGDPQAILVATNNPCGLPGRGPSARGAIFVVDDHTVRPMVSKPSTSLPYENAW